MNLYRQEIIDRARFPKYRAEMKTCDVQGEVMNVLCGDELTLFFMFDKKKETISSVSFSGQGCALMTAAADMLCGHLLEKNVSQLKKFTADDMMALYGEMPSPSRLKCVLLPYEALKRAKP